MPSDEETKLTKGFAFIEFLTPEVRKCFYDMHPWYCSTFGIP